MPREIAPDAPRERQTIRLPESKLSALRGWALDGSGLVAAARVRDPDGRIALVRNGWSDGWILPGGAVGSDEEPVEAARREVREETALDAVVEGPIVVFDQSYVAKADGGERFTAQYVVYAARADGEIPDASRLGATDGEIEAARWFESIPEDLHDGDLLRAYL
ncbi:NUDIX hydrolase [Halegenticoccus tardaugens]|uniref:NUDIX hydrolase n=1 Tax=Halegenticoccus tardaugens TaxID=2071624 RepID=UPI00100A8228